MGKIAQSDIRDTLKITAGQGNQFIFVENIIKVYFIIVDLTWSWSFLLNSVARLEQDPYPYHTYELKKKSSWVRIQIPGPYQNPNWTWIRMSIQVKALSESLSNNSDPQNYYFNKSALSLKLLAVIKQTTAH